MAQLNMAMGQDLTRGVRADRVRLLDLIIDPDYQRDLVPARVKSIMAAFERLALGSFIVSFRDQKHFLLDGQQRREALIRMGLGELPVWCLVLHGLTQDEESQLFDILNYGRTPVGPVIRFRNAVARGDLKQSTIKQLAEDAGWRLPLKSRQREAAGTLQCVSTLEDCYDNARRCDRVGAFTDMLGVVYEAYRDEKVATRGTFIKGMYLFCRDYWLAYDRTHVVEALRPVHPDHILRQTSGQVTGKNGMSGFLTFVAKRYNTGLKGKRRLRMPGIGETE